VKNHILAGLSLLVITACDAKQETTSHEQQPNYTAEANRIAQNTLITDGHIDVPYRLNDNWDDISKATETGDLDYPRSVAGGLNAPFMSIYTPAELDGTSDSKKHADAMIDIVERIVTESPDKFTITRTVAETEAAFQAKKIALPLGMENGAPISGDMANLQYFFDRGIRYITLTHSKSNHISDSSYDENKQWGGLSDFGKEVVTKMNQLGIMVDISHVSDEAFYDVMDITAVPAVATHSSARHFTPGFERNMSDAMIKRLAENGGVIMINYGSAFLTEEANKYNSARKAAYEVHLEQTGTEASDEADEAFEAIYVTKHPYPYADIEDVFKHIDHVVSLVGIDYVGLGSDYDGVGDTLPTGLKDVSSYPNLVAGLLKRGYSEEDIKKILSGNLIRVWKAVEAYAAEQ